MRDNHLFYKEEYFDNTSEMLRFINEEMEGDLVTILPIVSTNRYAVIYTVDAYEKAVFEFLSGMNWHIAGSILFIKNGTEEKAYNFSRDNYKQLLHDLKVY
jgi:hypothetical protein